MVGTGWTPPALSWAAFREQIINEECVEPSEWEQEAWVAGEKAGQYKMRQRAAVLMKPAEDGEMDLYELLDAIGALEIE